MSDARTELAVVESRHQLLQLFGENELAGRTVRGVPGESLALVGADLDHTVFDRCDLHDSDLGRARLEHA